ncbi:MAG: SWIM zinc finger family protein [Phycisphaerae bacterium]|nr:SWIM zinc finger family protein [Phycisphaerae bacterium]
MGASLDYFYQYPFASAVGEWERGFGLRLATCGVNQEHPYFFHGKLRNPRCIGDMLLVLSDIVTRHFFLRSPVLRDPVVTSSETMLRFEGFSGCCGVYARADFLPEAFQSDLQARGTTNVDFNNPMRAALTRLRSQENVQLSVGREEVAISRSGDTVVEKKVKLPIRWIKGFSEVQAYLPILAPMFEIDAHEARQFIRSLPRGSAPKQPTYVAQAQRSLRLSFRPSAGAIRLQGLDRIRVLEPLLGSAKGLRVWADNESGVSGWEVQFDVGRFFLLVSPESYRGFSGEGQILEKLAANNCPEAINLVAAELGWQNIVESDAISRKTGLGIDEVRRALAVLGSRGLAGYDVSAGAYFHRELPFELDKVEELQPRLQGARELLEENKVRLVATIAADQFDLLVEGTEVEHTVRLRPDQDKCTCPWFSKHQGQRGPCKHILAAQMFVEKGEYSE